MGGAAPPDVLNNFSDMSNLKVKNVLSVSMLSNYNYERIFKMLQGIISSNPFVSPVMPTKAPKPPPRTSSIDDGSAYKSSRVMTQVFRGSVTRITITHEMEKIYADTSSLSEEEEEMILAQCIRSGMPKVIFHFQILRNLSILRM